jgi:hypothetical protein
VVNPTPPVVPLAQSNSTTLPRNLPNPEGRNLSGTMTEDGLNDDGEPLLTSSQLSSQIHRREEDARRARGDVKDRDVREGDRSHSAGGPVAMNYSPEPQNRNHSSAPISNLSTYCHTSLFSPNPHFQISPRQRLYHGDILLPQILNLFHINHICSLDCRYLMVMSI